MNFKTMMKNCTHNVFNSFEVTAKYCDTSYLIKQHYIAD